MLELADGLSREEVVESLMELASAEPELVAGLDFPFSMPAWFARELGARSGPEVWELVAERGEGWLAEASPPFFGVAGTRRPERELLRRTDRELGAKSPFQIGGPGGPGTGGIRGMPLLRVLREEGFAVWPFDEVRAGAPVVVEVYPRVLTGPVNKSHAAARAAVLKRFELAPSVRDRATAGDDAFDALVAALAMGAHLDELRTLAPGDDTDRIEGRIWTPS